MSPGFNPFDSRLEALLVLELARLPPGPAPLDVIVPFLSKSKICLVAVILYLLLLLLAVSEFDVSVALPVLDSVLLIELPVFENV